MPYGNLQTLITLRYFFPSSGIYKGQYKKGLRHGYGSRSSYKYELSVSKMDMEKRERGGSFRSSVSSGLNSMGGDTLNRSTSSCSLGQRSLPESDPELNSQIYEGQWNRDKRHGHGVLRVPGNYVYCGEWSLNNRTGNGILIYEDGRREEGVWEKGQLVVPLKRKKLSLKYYQLESKVKQAHTVALQAADVARTKALLAESRASAAVGRAKLGLKAAEKADKDAEMAKKKADSLYTMEHTSLQKDVTTPTVAKTMDFVETDSLADFQSHSETISLLSVPSTISPTPSLENLSNYTRTLSSDSTLRKDENSSSNSDIQSLLTTSDGDSGIFISTESKGEVRPSPIIPPSPRSSLQRRASIPPPNRSSTHKLEKQTTEPSTASEFKLAKQRSLTTIDDSTGQFVAFKECKFL